MTKELNISLEDCCRYYSIEASFVQSLSERGLIELVQYDQTFGIDYEQLSDLEKYMHLHYDLDINMEGIEAINHLLQQINQLQSELRSLKNQVTD